VKTPRVGKTAVWVINLDYCVFGLHRTHEIRTIAIDDSGRLSVCKSDSLSNTRPHCVKTVERIEVLLGVET